MRRRLVRTLAALALVGAAGAAAPALAGSPYEGGVQPGQGGTQGARPAAAPPPARRGPAGLFDCSFRERRTKLERKNCGTLRP